MLMPHRSYASTANYRFGFNGKENDNEPKGLGNEQDYGMRVYDSRLGKFLSLDPLTNSYPFYSPYNYAGDMPISAIDLDGSEPKASVSLATITKDRTAIEIYGAISVKIQVINLSATAIQNFDLETIAQNLKIDLENKLNGSATTILTVPFEFKSKGNYITEVIPVQNAKDAKSMSVTYHSTFMVDASIVTDITKISKESLVFAIIDDVNSSDPKEDPAGKAIKEGQVAVGEAQYFIPGKQNDEGRSLALHEVLHNLGFDDTYNDKVKSPETDPNNIMNYLIPGSKREVTNFQKVSEAFVSIFGPPALILTPGPYIQPKSKDDKKTIQQKLIEFIKANGTATKIK